MSMFRSPNDISTSDPESSSDEQETLESSSVEVQTPPGVSENVAGVAETPLQREETASESLPDNDYTRESTDWLPNTAEQHATLLIMSRPPSISIGLRGPADSIANRPRLKN